jgi:hypothetical protein
VLLVKFGSVLYCVSDSTKSLIRSGFSPGLACSSRAGAYIAGT